MDMILIFLMTFILFIAIWIIGLLIGKSVQKKSTSKFKGYFIENLPDINPQKTEVLIAKQKSKQVRPDILLMLDKTKYGIIIITERKKDGISHKRYDSSDIQSVESSNQVLSRGFFPKTHSYEETLKLAFKDGNTYQLTLENLSNKQGNDSGAEVVKKLFAPWRQKLNVLKNQE